MDEIELQLSRLSQSFCDLQQKIVLVRGYLEIAHNSKELIESAGFEDSDWWDIGNDLIDAYANTFKSFEALERLIEGKDNG